MIPEQREQSDDTGTNSIGLNPAYLGDVGKTAKHLVDGKVPGVKFTLAGEFEPVRIDLRNNTYEIDTAIVIMPMRI